MSTRRRLGQTTVEYMLTISVVSLAIIGTMLAFETIFGDNAASLSEHLATSTLVSTGIQQ